LGSHVLYCCLAYSLCVCVCVCVWCVFRHTERELVMKLACARACVIQAACVNLSFSASS
jgi:hypothetical protein